MLVSFVKKHRLDGITFNHRYPYFDELIEVARYENIPLNIYYVENESDAVELFNLGVCSIYTPNLYLSEYSSQKIVDVIDKYEY